MGFKTAIMGFKTTPEKNFEATERLSASSLDDDNSTDYLKGWHNPQSMQRRPFLSLCNFVLIQFVVIGLFTAIFFSASWKQMACCKNAPGFLYCRLQIRPLCLHENVDISSYALQHLQTTPSKWKAKFCTTCCIPWILSKASLVQNK